MNMKTEFNQLAYDMINDTFADVALDLTIINDASVYDEDTGETLDFNTPGVTIKAIIGPFDETKENGFSLQVGDLQAVIPVLALTINEQLFLQSDTFEHGGSRYIAIAKQKDPSESVYRVQLRK